MFLTHKPPSSLWLSSLIMQRGFNRSLIHQDILLHASKYDVFFMALHKSTGYEDFYESCVLVFWMCTDVYICTFDVLEWWEVMGR